MVGTRNRDVAALLIWLSAVGCAHGQTPQPVDVLAPPPGPMVAVVALKEQTFVLYGPSLNGAPGIVRSTDISSGLASNPTPIGVFSLLEKRKEHWSNLYDAEMPHMQRLTWSGIALHEGRVTGRPASHGCVRLPAAFAEDLFGITRVGMRVIIAYSATEPVDIAHDALFVPRVRRETAQGGLVRVAAAGGEMPTIPMSPTTPSLSGPSSLQGGALISARKDARTQARAAAKIDEDVKKAHAVLLADVARLAKAKDTAERAVRAAERLEAAERKALDTAAEASRERVIKALAAASAKRITAEARLQDAVAALSAKRDANASALKQADDAETDAKTTWEAYRRLMRIGEPVSVLISTKTGLLSVRQAFDPIFEVPLEIVDRVGARIGTHVFTLMDAGDNSTTGVARWSVVTLPQLPGEPRTWHVADLPPSTLPEAPANVALDRILIPADVRARIEAVLVPGSSLIISDEAPSPETGKGTDFIVEMSGMPNPSHSPMVRPAAPQPVQRSVVERTAPPRPVVVMSRPATPRFVPPPMSER